MFPKAAGGMKLEDSQSLFERALRVIPGGVNSPVRAFRAVGGSPFFTARADGCRLYTADGRELVDYVCTWGPAIHGHNHPYIRNSVAEAVAEGLSFGTPNPRELPLAERVVNWVPGAEKVRFCNSGTEATMTAIRLARGATGRDKVIKFEGCYHGHVDALLVKAGSGALTLGNPDSAGVPASFAGETVVLPFNDLGAVEAAFESLPDQVAAVIVEPYPANCGLILPKPGYLAGLRELCDRFGSLLIFDEVMTGFRLSRGGVQEREGIHADLSALGKVLGGGLPVGAVAGAAVWMDLLAPLGPVYQAGTLSGNPLAMAAGEASLELLEDGKSYQSLEESGARLAEGIRAEALRKGIALQVPQVGSMFCLFFAPEPIYDATQAMASDRELYARLFHYALNEGVYLPPSAFETCFLSSAHDDDALNRTLEVLTAGLKAL